MKHLNSSLSCLTLLSLSSLLMIVGCGGGASQTATSASDMTLRIHWPDAAPSSTRVVPAAAQSVQVELVESTGTATAGARQVRTLNRPTNGTVSQLVFLGVTSTNVTLTGRAYAAKDAQGVLLAQSATTANLNVLSSVDLTLNSTISQITLGPTPFTLGVGATQQVNATGKDNSGNLIPLTLSASKWTSSDEGIARVDASGNVFGVRSGTATITYQDTESNRTATLSVTVNSAPPPGNGGV
jgi:uncharacterized protein YjdB